MRLLPPQSCAALLLLLVDDDTFIALPQLFSVAAGLRSRYARFYAGHFEWYNVIPGNFRVIGWGSGPRQASYAGRSWENCTIDGSNPSSYRHHHHSSDTIHPGSDSCIGPFSFAMGYLFMLSRAVVRDLVVNSTWLARDYERATELERTRLSHAVFHDVQLGLWATQLQPGLTYVALHNLGILNVRGDGRYTSLNSETLLSAHRLPFACWHNASLPTRSRIATTSSRMSDPLHGVSCSHDTQGDKHFTSWTLRPSEARTCIPQPPQAQAGRPSQPDIACHAQRMQAEASKPRAAASSEEEPFTCDGEIR